MGGIKSGTNLMLLGPPMCGKDSIIDNVICNTLKNDEGVILVSTALPGEKILKRFEELDPSIKGKKSRFGVVDCVSRTLGMDVPDITNIRRVSSPVDLTGIGVKISQFFEYFYMKEKIQKTRLIVDSLSTMLMYSNLQSIFRFLHVFTGRIKAAEAIGIYSVESGMHDERTVATLKKLFDGMIKIKEEDDQFFIRVAGPGPKATRWMKYEIVDAKIVIRGD